MTIPASGIDRQAQLAAEERAERGRQTDRAVGFLEVLEDGRNEVRQGHRRAAGGVDKTRSAAGLTMPRVRAAGLVIGE